MSKPRKPSFYRQLEKRHADVFDALEKLGKSLRAGPSMSAPRI